MTKSPETNPTSEWMTAHEAFAAFCAQHPELGLRPSYWSLHNLLRHHRQPLEAADALRRANGRHWIAHRERFDSVLFDLLTLSTRCELRPA
jgi:hypothetical protein